MKQRISDAAKAGVIDSNSSAFDMASKLMGCNLIKKAAGGANSNAAGDGLIGQSGNLYGNGSSSTFTAAQPGLGGPGGSRTSSNAPNLDPLAGLGLPTPQQTQPQPATDIPANPSVNDPSAASPSRSPTENGKPNTAKGPPSPPDLQQRAKAAGVQLTPQIEEGLRNGHPKVIAAVEHLTSAQEDLARTSQGTSSDSVSNPRTPRAMATINADGNVNPPGIDPSTFPSASASKDPNALYDGPVPAPITVPAAQAGQPSTEKPGNAVDDPTARPRPSSQPARDAFLAERDAAHAEAAALDKALPPGPQRTDEQRKQVQQLITKQLIAGAKAREATVPEYSPATMTKLQQMLPDVMKAAKLWGVDPRDVLFPVAEEYATRTGAKRLSDDIQDGLAGLGWAVGQNDHTDGKHPWADLGPANISFHAARKLLEYYIVDKKDPRVSQFNGTVPSDSALAKWLITDEGTAFVSTMHQSHYHDQYDPLISHPMSQEERDRMAVMFYRQGDNFTDRYAKQRADDNLDVGHPDPKKREVVQARIKSEIIEQHKLPPGLQGDTTPRIPRKPADSSFVDGYPSKVVQIDSLLENPN